MEMKKQIKQIKQIHVYKVSKLFDKNGVSTNNIGKATIMVASDIKSGLPLPFPISHFKDLGLSIGSLFTETTVIELKKNPPKRSKKCPFKSEK